MITLYIFPEAFGLRNVSPFCLKVEMALKYLKLDYQIEIMTDPRKAPKGKLPFVDIGGEVIADSEIIFDRLDKQTQGGLFGDLSPTERAQGVAFTRLVEDHLYWMLVASRWLDDDWWPHVRDGFFGEMPGIVRAIVAPMERKQVLQTYNLQGLGKHTLDEQKQFALDDLQAINDIVSESGHIVGGRLTVFDFTVAALISGLLDNKPTTWVTEIASTLPALGEYAERIQNETGIFGRQLAA